MTTSQRIVDDEQAVQATLAGEVDAFAFLVDRYSRMAYVIAYARLGNRQAAEDLTQEVFLRAYLHLPNLTIPGHFSSWISQIARNLACDWNRQGRQTSDLVHLIPVEELPDTEAQEADTKMEDQEQFERVHEAAMRLPPEEREVVLLHYAEGLSKKEIAERLGIHPSTVGRQISRGLNAMRASFTAILRDSSRSIRPSRQAIARGMALIAAASIMTPAAKAAVVSVSIKSAGCSAALLAGSVGTAGTGVVSLAALKAFLAAIGTRIASLSIGAKIVATVTSGAMVGGGTYYVAQVSRERSASAIVAESKVSANSVSTEIGNTPPAAGKRSATTEAATRILHFPTNRSIGSLHVQDGTLKRSLRSPGRHTDDGWVYWGEATGEVSVPADKKLCLTVNAEAFKDLSPLARLGPNDLHELQVYAPPRLWIDGNQQVMTHLKNLTGLEVLRLHGLSLNDQSLQVVAKLKALKHLVLAGPDNRIADEGLTWLTPLEGIEILSLESSGLTDAGLAHIAKLTSLRELSLSSSQLRGPGLAYLAGLPSFRVLVLRGGNPYFKRATDNTLGDNALAYLSNLSDLKELDLGWLQITNKGMSHLSRLTGLETLELNWCSKIGNAGLVHLKPLHSLKRLGLEGTRITDGGAAALKECKSIESLTLPGEGISDNALADLAQMDRLNKLALPNSGKQPVTDSGLADLKRLQSLEKLVIDGKRITDEGMSHLGAMTNLKELIISDLPAVSDEGLARLVRLKSLEILWLDNAPEVTLSGLNRLNEIPGLVELNATGIGRGKSRLDLSRLAKLRWLWINSKDPLDDKDLACLAKLKHLEWLQVNAGNCTDEGLAYLKGLTFLEILSLGRAQLTGKGLTYLSDMKRLNNLTISGDFVDADLHQIEGLKGLRILSITPRKELSRSALESFQSRMPNLLSITASPAEAKQGLNR